MNWIARNLWLARLICILLALTPEELDRARPIVGETGIYWGR